ncbi:recombinase family protein [Nitrospira sp. Nam74]
MRDVLDMGFPSGVKVFGYKSRGLEDLNRVWDPRGLAQMLGYRLIIYLPEAVVVQSIFKLFASGASLKSIVNYIRMQFPRYHMPHCRIRSILMNELYGGLRIYHCCNKTHTRKRTKKTTVAPPCEWQVLQDESLRIVSDETWRKTLERLKRDNYFNNNRHSKKNWILACFAAGQAISVIREELHQYSSVWMSNTSLRRVLSRQPHRVHYRLQRPIEVNRTTWKRVQQRVAQMKSQWGKRPRPRSATEK